MTSSRQLCELINRTTPQPNGHGPISLLLKHGVEYTKRKPAPWRGTTGACYANSQYLAKRRKGWRYVEGYAAYLIPVEHAWCLDPEGNVVDPTWDDDKPADYFGIEFDLELVRQIRKLPGGRSYSVLFTWWKPQIYSQLEAYFK